MNSPKTVSLLSDLKMSREQAIKLMSMPNVTNTDSRHMAGITCFVSISMNKTDWIIDSGTTDHITPYVEFLKEVKALNTPYKVTLPDGN